MLVQRNLTVARIAIDNLNQLRGCTLCDLKTMVEGITFLPSYLELKPPRI
jgi:hypothetical protein